MSFTFQMRRFPCSLVGIQKKTNSLIVKVLLACVDSVISTRMSKDFRVPLSAWSFLTQQTPRGKIWVGSTRSIELSNKIPVLPNE